MSKPGLIDALVARAARSDFAQFEAQLRSSGYCAHPVRLRGVVERCDARGGRVLWSTADEPDGILRKACGNRREAVCGPCAERYRKDAYHLIAAGLRGGKGVPESVTEHPMMFLTLTAPSFGLVHTHREDPNGSPRRCRPRRDAGVCPHGVRLSCGRVHASDDPCLGDPLCVDCFDYEGALLWNNAVGELWRRTTIYLPRALARTLGVTQKQLRRLVRCSYVKVAEYQARGLIHLHVAVRLDRAMPAYRRDEIRPPSPRFTIELLERAIRAAVAAVSAPVPQELGDGALRWGDELDIQPIVGPGQVAGYLAKYATKSTEQAGGVLHRVREEEVDRLPARDHVRRYLRTAFALDRQAPAEHRLARCAHAFGHRGHCLTKSRRYSTTFKALREAREQYIREQLLKCPDPSESQDQLAQTAKSDRVGRWKYVGRGHLTTADAFLAASAAARAREERQAARDELRSVVVDQVEDEREGSCGSILPI
jgi:hypothetical protein